MKRRFRLTRSDDFKRVRRAGRSFTHPLVVLYVTAVDGPAPRVGVAAGRTVGGAVQRNRAKRLLREAMRSLLPDVAPGWDMLLFARAPLSAATLHQTQAALISLLRRAGVMARTQDG